MSRLIEWIQKPKVVLKIFPTYRDLRNWVMSNEKEIKESGSYNNLTMVITFNNGNRLYLGHAETDADMDKFLGLEYDLVLGGNDYLRDRATMNRL